MDEAHFLGRGRYQDKHGYRDRVEILTEHLAKVVEIAKNHGFTLMMWSDMFIRLHNNGEYYGTDIKIPQETIDQVPQGVELVYWDYYSKEKEHYDHMFRTHADFKNPTAFAGGIWTWTGYAPNQMFSADATEAAMRSIQGFDVDTVFFTLWGDNGKDCSYFATLPVLFAAARMAQGIFDREVIAKEFQEKYGYTFEEFMDLELPNITEEEPSHYHDPCKYLIFNDPFLGIYDFTVNEDLPKCFMESAKKLSKSINGRKYDYLFDMEKRLLDAMACKCDLGVRLREAYQSDDKGALAAILEEFPVIKQKLKAFFEGFRQVWLKENKPFGLEVQEQRFGGLMYRMETCEARLHSYLGGEITVIEELEEKSLEKFEGFTGKAIVNNDWRGIVTTSVC